MFIEKIRYLTNNDEIQWVREQIYRLALWVKFAADDILKQFSFLFFPENRK